MVDQTAICNFALSHLGISKEIANIDEKSESARACKRFWDIAVEETFREIPWSFAIKYEDLGLIEESPNTEWGYSYRYPSDCARIQKIISGTRNETEQTRIPYALASDNEGLLIYADGSEAILKYIKKITDTNFFPADYAMMLSYLLASYIAPRITGGDPYKLGEKTLQMYYLKKSTAAATMYNEQQVDKEPDAETIREREFGYSY